MLGLSDAICMTTNIAAGKSSGSCVTSFVSASSPPLEAPITMMSRFAM
jgi:hypothetical protein